MMKEMKKEEGRGKYVIVIEELSNKLLATCEVLLKDC